MLQGLSNVAVSMFMGYPVTGSFSRTSVNTSCGASSKLSFVISSLVVGIVLFWMTPALFYLPKFALSAIVLLSVINLVDVAEAAFLWYTSKREFFSFITVLVLSLTLGFETGLLCGIIVSWMGAGMHFHHFFALCVYINPSSPALLKNTSVLHVQIPRVSLLRMRGNMNFVDVPKSGAVCADVALVKLSGNIWFASCEVVEQAVQTVQRLFAPSATIIVMEHSALVDASGMTTLDNIAETIKKKSGIPLMLTGLGPGSLRALERAREAQPHLAESWNLAPRIGGISTDKPPNLLGFPTVHDALDYCSDSLLAKSDMLQFSDEALALVDHARLVAWRTNDTSPEVDANLCRYPSFARSVVIQVVVDERYSAQGI